MGTRRVTARVLPVDDHGEVLLLQDQDPACPGVLRWGSIGGGIDPGESPLDAAVREMWEETGIVIEPGQLLGPVHQDTHSFSYDGVAYVWESTFYAFRLERETEISFAGLEPGEVGNVVAASWWSPEALDQDGTAVVPGLTSAMRAAIRVMEGAT